MYPDVVVAAVLTGPVTPGPAGPAEMLPPGTAVATVPGGSSESVGLSR